MRLAGWVLAATLVGTLGLAAAADESARVDALEKKISGGSGRPADAPPASQRAPTAHDLLEWYGIAQLGTTIASLEAQASDLTQRDKALSAALQEKMKTLKAAVGTDTVATAVGADSAHGLGWECRRAPEIMSQLAVMARGANKLADDYVASIDEVPIGREDSAKLLQAKTDRFRFEVGNVLNDADSQAIQKDLQILKEGFLQHSGTAGSVLGMSNHAIEAARALRVNALSLQEVGAELVPRLEAYRLAKIEARQELEALKPLSVDSARISVLEDRLSSSPDSPNNEKVLGPQIRKEVDARVAEAEAALGDVEKLTKPIEREAADCDTADLAQKFEGARVGAGREITAAQQKIEKAHAARRTQIELADQKAAEVMSANQKTAADMNGKIEKLKARYDSTPRDDTANREKILATLKKAQNISKQATDEVLRMQLARQGFEGELSAGTEGTAAAQVMGSLMKLFGVGSN